LADVAAHWDSVPEYDAINARIDSYFRRFTDSAPLFQIPPQAHVLDVDCRSAVGTVFFHARYPAARFTCMPMSSLFERRTREQMERHGIGGTVAVFRALPLPFGDGTFDVVLTYETIEHVPWPEEYVRELSRVLKRGGTMVLTTPSVLWEPVHALSAALRLDHGEGPHRMLRRQSLLRAFRDAGLEVMTERSFVLIPVGPSWLLAFGRWLEQISPQWLLRQLCLRRTFVCTKP